ncbi:hypothetical protein QR685DRAFT_573658 [Neurospora intermedia]|uniref:Secreted protein n=1 Tax=Neurospora intermedia TaxID=5142 RepID=A0ABR3D6R7_NEUIN
MYVKRSRFFLLIACELSKSFEHILLQPTRFQAPQLKNTSTNVATKRMHPLPGIVVTRQNTEDLQIEERRSKRTNPEGKTSEPIKGISQRASSRTTIVASGIALGHQKD